MSYSIYFIHAPELKLIKIGLSNNIKRALYEIQLNSPCPVVLLGTRIGTKKDLLALQAQYRRKHNDWFEAQDELLSAAQTFTPTDGNKKYKDISYLCLKYSISRKKINKIINWLENSKKINLTESIYSYSVKPSEDWLDRHFTVEAITMIEIGIVNYSKKHPKAQITFGVKYQAVEGWDQVL